MHHIRKVAIAIGVAITAIAAAVVFTGLFANFQDPLFQRSLLRLLAIVGFAAVLAMCASLLARVEPVDQLAAHPSPRRSRGIKPATRSSR